MSKMVVPVPDEIAPFVRSACLEGLCVLQASLYPATVQMQWTGFLLPPSHTDASCIIDGVSFDFSADMTHTIIPAARGQVIRSRVTGACTPYLCCLFEEERLEFLASRFFGVSHFSVVTKLFTAPAGLRDDVARLLEEARRDSPDARGLVESLGTVVAIECLRAVLQGTCGGDHRRARHPGIQDALRCIEEQFDTELRLDALAAAAHLCKSRFIALFKQEIGFTPHEFLRRVRVERAMHLLREGNDVTDACFAVGFTSMSGFEEAFARIAHMNPVEYRLRSRS